MVIHRVKMLVIIAHFGKVPYVTYMSTSLIGSLAFGLGVFFPLSYSLNALRRSRDSRTHVSTPILNPRQM
jgi:hypothetical protein